jgi:hypothetical protein
MNGHRIYFITGVTQEAQTRGERSHQRINDIITNSPQDIEEFLKFVRTRLENQDFLSMTITRDSHDK